MRSACSTSWCPLQRDPSHSRAPALCWASPTRVYSEGAELRQVVRGLMEGCRDRLVAALTRRDHATARRLSSVMDALLHLDGEVRRHAEPRFLVEATLARLAVELGTTPEVGINV